MAIVKSAGVNTIVRNVQGQERLCYEPIEAEGAGTVSFVKSIMSILIRKE